MEKTLRDEFAMAALTGMLFEEYWQSKYMSEAAVGAYEFADAMLAARGTVREPLPGEIDAHFREQELASPSHDLTGELVAALRDVTADLEEYITDFRDFDGYQADPRLCPHVQAARAVLAKLPSDQ